MMQVTAQCNKHIKHCGKSNIAIVKYDFSETFYANGKIRRSSAMLRNTRTRNYNHMCQLSKQKILKIVLKEIKK